MDFTPVANRPSGRHPAPRVLPQVEVLEDRLVPAVSVTSARWQSASVDIGFSSSSINRTLGSSPLGYQMLSSGPDLVFGTRDDNPVPVEEVQLGSTSVVVKSSGPMPRQPIRITVKAGVLGASRDFTDIVYPPGMGGSTQTPTVQVALRASSDTGVSNSDGITNKTTPTFDVTVSHAGTVELRIGTRTERRTVTAAGTIAITPASPLTDGSYSVVAKLITQTGAETSRTWDKSLVIDTVGPRATFGAATVTGSVSSRSVQFNEDVVSTGNDPSRFTTVDVVITGPGNRHVPVSSVSGSGRNFTVSFPTQTQTGEYRMTVGVEIADLAGNFMNQDGDGINGETTQDLALDRFTIAAPAPTNTAPRLDLGGQFRMPDILEDATSNSGVLVRDLIASAGSNRITDPDRNAQQGIAIVRADTTRGTWQYSLDNGSTWRAMGSPSAGAARLLASDSQTRLRFVPDLNWNGTLASAISFRAWDRTTGSNGNTANITSTGGSTAFSSTTANVALTVRAVNDAPVLDNTGDMRLTSVKRNDNNNPGTLLRDMVASAGGQRITDVDAGAKQGIAVIGLDSRNGRWEFSFDNGKTWRRFDAPSPTSARLLPIDATTRVRFIPNTGYVGTMSNALTFRAWDQTTGSAGAIVSIGSVGGTTAFSSATETASLVVVA